MRHERTGSWRLVAAPLAWLGALVIAPAVMASPSTTGATTLDVTDCKATVAVGWSAQPGRYKSYTVEISSDADTSVQTLGSGSFARTGNLILQLNLATYGFSNQFHAVTRVFDGKGVEQLMWPSADVAAPCI